MKILLIRHGEIPSNLKKIYAGRSNEALTEKGYSQAEKVSEHLSVYSVDALYSSPVHRALQTAGIISSVIGIEPKVTNEFREIDMGPWEGLSEKEVASSFPVEWQIWNSRPAELSLPGRETLQELLDRVLIGVRALPEETSAIVTHVAVIRVLILWNSGQDLNLYKTIEVPNAKVFELMIDREKLFK